MIRVYCDKCGEEIRYKPVNLLVNGPQIGSHEYELCDACAKKIVEMMDE